MSPQKPPGEIGALSDRLEQVGKDGRSVRVESREIRDEEDDRGKRDEGPEAKVARV